MIHFNKPYRTGNEIGYIKDAVDNQLQISGNGHYTKKCQSFIENRYAVKKCLLTNSCTDALEMCAILIGISPGDEVIMPSYTFTSTANAFILRGAKVVFCDSMVENPNINHHALETLITDKTKAIIAVHYAGIACDMDSIVDVAKRHGLYVVEDAAQAIESTYKGKQLGTIGHLGTFSFHETKNIQCGEGGMLMINDPAFINRSEILWEKGTNRAAFWRGEVDKYGWVDIGSSYLPSELNAAYLWAQFERLEDIQSKRIELWNRYNSNLKNLDSKISNPDVPGYASVNAHMYYIVCSSLEDRQNLISHLKSNDIHSVFHYQSLHASPYFEDKHDGRELFMSDKYSNQLLRLPLYYDLSIEDVDNISELIQAYYAN